VRVTLGDAPVRGHRGPRRHRCIPNAEVLRSELAAGAALDAGVDDVGVNLHSPPAQRRCEWSCATALAARLRDAWPPVVNCNNAAESLCLRRDALGSAGSEEVENG
jgi:hypothetical protein